MVRFALLALATGALAVCFATLPAATASPLGRPAVKVRETGLTPVHYSRRHKHRHARYYDEGTVVDAPFAYVDTRGRRTWVDAPFTAVRVHRRGVWVRAPFVNVYVPR